MEHRSNRALAPVADFLRALDVSLFHAIDPDEFTRVGAEAPDFLPTLLPASNDPEEQQSQRCSGAIQQHVPDGALTRWHKGLMKLVGGGVQDNQAQGKTSLGPSPWPGVRFDRLANRPPEKQCQKGILRQMRAFAYDKNAIGNGLIGKMGEKPADDRGDELR